MSDIAKIIWTPEQEALIKQGLCVPLGILVWNAQDDTMSVLLCEGQNLAQVRAMITAYVRPDKEEFSTRIKSEDENNTDK